MSNGSVTFRAGRGTGGQFEPAALAQFAGPHVLLCDISAWQPDIADATYLAWSKAVIIRAMYGTAVDRAWYGGQRRDLLLLGGAQFLGIYQFLTASEDAATQARALAQLLGKLNPGEYVIADIEEGDGPQQARWQAWAEVIHGELGFAPGTYSGENFAATHALAPVDWVAAYQSSEPSVPHRIWQFTDAYDIPGVGVADCSLFHGPIEELRAMAYQGHPVPPKPAPGPPQSAGDAAGFTAIAIKIDALGVHLNTITSQLEALDGKLAVITNQQEKIMSEDAAVLAVVTDEQAQVAALGTSVGALQALVVALQAEVTAGSTALQPGTLAALQAAEASLDSLAATGAADVATDTPAPPVTPPTP